MTVKSENENVAFRMRRSELFAFVTIVCGIVPGAFYCGSLANRVTQLEGQVVQHSVLEQRVSTLEVRLEERLKAIDAKLDAISVHRATTVQR